MSSLHQQGLSAEAIVLFPQLLQLPVFVIMKLTDQ